jgi:hypothetical protein
MTIWSNISTFLGRIFTFNQAEFDELVADMKQGIEVAESDLAMAAAWVTANGPSLVSEAQTLLSVLAALTGNLTIPASVIAALKVAISDMQQFVGAVTTATSSGTAAHAFDALAAYGGSDTSAVVANGYGVHSALTQALAAARVALASASKKAA